MYEQPQLLREKLVPNLGKRFKKHKDKSVFSFTRNEEKQVVLFHKMLYDCGGGAIPQIHRFVVLFSEHLERAVLFFEFSKKM